MICERCDHPKFMHDETGCGTYLGSGGRCGCAEMVWPCADPGHTAKCAFLADIIDIMGLPDGATDTEVLLRLAQLRQCELVWLTGQAESPRLLQVDGTTDAPDDSPQECED